MAVSLKDLTQQYVARLCESPATFVMCGGCSCFTCQLHTHTNLTHEALSAAAMASDSCSAALFSCLFLAKLGFFAWGSRAESQ